MSTFPVSPRPYIVNGVLVTVSGDTKRHNGLQGTNYKEDFYRSLSQISLPVPDTNISATEPVSSSCDIPCNGNQQHDCPNSKNTNRPADFAQERRNISDQSANVTHCIHGRLFEPRESESKTSQSCTHSNCHSHSRGNKLHSIVEQGTNACCEGTSLMNRVEWESGDHHRSTTGNSPNLNDECCPYASNPRCCNAAVTCNSNHLKYPHQGTSAKNIESYPALEECRESIHQEHLLHNARTDSGHKECQDIMHEGRSLCSVRRDPAFEECQENIHQGRSPCSSTRDNACEECQEDVHQGRSSHIIRRHPAVEECQECVRHRSCIQPREQTLADDKSIYRTSNSIRLHEPGNSSENTENCLVIANSEDTCNPQNALQETLSKEKSRPPSNEQPEHKQYIAKETPHLRESHNEEFFGYPPQRGTDVNQYKIPSREEGSGDLHAEVQHGQRNTINMQEPQIYLMRNAKKQREASSVAEIFNHPIWEAYPDHSEASARQRAPSLRNPDSEEALGYPAQIATLGKSKYTLHRTHENETQSEELQHHEFNNGQTQMTGDLNYSTSNDPSMSAEIELKQTYANQRNLSTYGNECGRHEPSCRTSHKSHVQLQNLTEEGRERAYARDTVQGNVCASPGHYSKNKSCIGTRNVESVSQESCCHNQHCSETPDDKMCHLSFENRESSDREYHSHQLDEIAHRHNKEVRGRSNFGSYRSPPCCEDEFNRAENEHEFHAPGCQHSSNRIRSSELGYACPESYRNVPGKDEDTHQDTNAFQGEVVQDKGYAQGTQFPTTAPCNNCETEHVTANDSCEYSKATEELQETMKASCDINNPDDDTVSCHADQPRSSDKGSSELPSPNRPRITELHRRRNGIDYEDQVGWNVVNRTISLGENSEVKGGKRKHRMLIHHGTRSSANRQNKTTMPSKENTDSVGGSGERKAPQSFTSKSRIPKTKACATLSSHKSNKTSGSPQRPMQTTGHNKNYK